MSNENKQNDELVQELVEARKYAKSLLDVWGDDIEQVELHLESDGFSDGVVGIVVEEIEIQLLG